MKARFVHESVNFQRGRDPMDAMSIGRKAITIDFGKYSGGDIYEVYEEDPRYILWLADNMTPRNDGQRALLGVAKKLANDYHQKVAGENITYYGSPGDLYEGIIKVQSTKYMSGDYGSYYVIQGEADKHLFRFSFSFTQIYKQLGATDETVREIMGDLVGKEIEIKGKVKFHREYLERKWTNLNYVKLLNVL